MQVDVAIIGGGFTGLSAAWHLAQAQPELNIALFEARGVGHGASGRNGGMVLPQTPDESMQIDYDDATHRWTYHLTVGSMDALAKFVEAAGEDCDLRLNGYLNVFTWPEDVEYYHNYVMRAQKMGLPLEIWDAQKTKATLGTDVYAGAVYDPNGGSVHPMKLIRAMKRMAEAAGVQIYEHSPVLDIHQGEIIELEVGSAHHRVRASTIVLATNAYTSKLGFFRSNLMPLHTQCLVTAPLTDAQLDAIGWHSDMPFYDSRTLLYHFVLTPDHRIVMGGGNADYFFNNGVKYRGNLGRVERQMRVELGRVFPALADVIIEDIWNGVLGVTWDEHSSVGIIGDDGNIIYALGYNGHGVNLAFLFGRLIADIYQHKPMGLWRYASFLDYPLPWIPPEPFRWVGAQIMLSK
jgi:glycine/D-amino acid oxidase-like deaminating enzyme